MLLLLFIGVGPKKDLQELNIPVHSDLKVGYNLQDHVSLSPLTFLVNQPVTILESNITYLPADYPDIELVMTLIYFMKLMLLSFFCLFTGDGHWCIYW